MQARILCAVNAVGIGTGHFPQVRSNSYRSSFCLIRPNQLIISLSTWIAMSVATRHQSSESHMILTRLRWTVDSRRY